MKLFFPKECGKSNPALLQIKKFGKIHSDVFLQVDFDIILVVTHGIINLLN